MRKAASTKWIFIVTILFFYIFFIRGSLLGYLFANDLLGGYGAFIDTFNRLTGVNFGTGPHPLEEYRQRSDIFLFQLVLLFSVIAFTRYIFRKRARVILVTINGLLLIVVLFVTEVILSTDKMQKRFGSYQDKALRNSINSLTKSQRNSYGFRDSERQKKKRDGVIRIAVLGDSFVYGDGLINTEDIWSHILQSKIAKTYGDSVEIVSWGSNGWSTYNEFRYLRGPGSEFDIDYLIVGWFWNDPHIPGISMPRRLFIWHKVALRVTPFFKNSVQFITEWINRRLYGLPYFHNWGHNGWRNALYREDNLQAYADLLVEFKNHLTQLGIKFLFVSTPVVDHNSVHRQQQRLVFSIFDQNDILYLDLYDEVMDTFGDYSVERIRQELWANPGNSHPGKPLTTLYADAVFHYLETNRLLPGKSSKFEVSH